MHFLCSIYLSLFLQLSKKTRTILVFLCLFIAFMISFNKFVFSLKMNGYSTAEKIISYIFSPVGVSMASEEINYTGDHYQYIGFNNIFQTEFGKYFIAVLSNCLIYFLLAVALSYIRKIDFQSCFIRSFHIKKQISNSSSSDYPYPNDIQEDPTGMECFVEVRNLYKFFKFRRNIGSDIDDDDTKLGKTFAANNNVSFRVYKDEIFAILGHNGAGKSTLIQNMVGIYHPDSGETFYRGIPLSSNKKRIQLEMGICLQNNVLIEGFTVADHFKLYAGIKGASATEADLEAWLEEIDLVSKKNFEVQKMSGGQKRKLCIGLALIGHPKYVFLDEPTTGLDPLSRRKIWSLLLKVKKNRVIFITTHYMDEADIIADRKLILSKGCIRCLGSSVYLKNHFQMKYSLEINTAFPTFIESIIREYVPEATYFNNKTDIECDITDRNSLTPYESSYHIWKLPMESSSIFSTLLKELENEKGKLLKDFSLSAPLLEELFVQLDRESDAKENGDAKYAIELPNSDMVKRPSHFVTGLRLASYRIKLYMRRKLYLLIAIVLPFIILTITLPKFNKQFSENNAIQGFKKLEFNSDLYKNQRWNYDIGHSGGNGTIARDIFEREFPKLSGGQPSLEFHSEEEMEGIGQAIFKEPYFVSSIQGNYSNGGYSFSIYYNDSMPHALPYTVNVVSNAILAANNFNETIHASNHPFSYFSLVSLSEVKFYSSIIVSICVAFGLSFYGSGIVHEKKANLLKQLQLNGISNRSYWISCFISDYFWFLITCVVVLFSIAICKYIPLYYFNSLTIIGLFFVLCSIGCILFQYCVSFAFNKENSAFIAFLVVNILPTLYFTSEAYKKNMESDSEMFTTAFYYFAIGIDAFLPSYCFIRVIKNLISLGIEHQALGYSLSFSNLLFTMRSQLSCHFIGAALSIVIYGSFLIYLVKKVYHPNRKDVYEPTKEIKENYEKELREGDEDIYYEYLRIKKDLNNHHMPMKLINLTKEYDRLKFSSTEELREAMQRTTNYKYGEYHCSSLNSRRIVMTAFENMNIGIDKCECFGILGPNGSGKSSLLNTASFTFKQTIGDIYYDGQNTLDRKGNEITLGYCPQEDTLWEEMTLYEHIEMFLYIRGYSKKESKRYAKKFIQYCRLTSHKNKLPSELSGGTRRKLNILIALCCSSSKVMLDEPSAGMDPSTRRYVWDIIKATLQKNKSSTIMTTHSMEEAELLCNRIAIMIHGKLQCIGSPEHIKMKYGNTYILDVHTKDIAQFHQEVVLNRNLFGNAQYKKEDKSLQRVKYEVKSSNNISRIFEIMESCRILGLFDDYNYSQTSLEQVFLNFALKSEE